MFKHSRRISCDFTTVKQCLLFEMFPRCSSPSSRALDLHDVSGLLPWNIFLQTLLARFWQVFCCTLFGRLWQPHPSAPKLILVISAAHLAQPTCNACLARDLMPVLRSVGGMALDLRHALEPIRCNIWIHIVKTLCLSLLKTRTASVQF